MSRGYHRSSAGGDSVRLQRFAGSVPSSLILQGPHAFVEYSYYAILFYGTVGPLVGLSAGRGGGAMLLLLATYCGLALGLARKVVFQSLRLPILCAVLEILVQVLAHGESPIGDHVRYFVTWILALIIIQSLLLRPGFAHRFSLVILMVGLTVVPFLSVRTEGFLADRAGGGEVAGGFSNPNALGNWFGFCCVYLAVFGLETKRALLRIAAWVGAVGCLYVVGLSVSRGALVAVAASLVVAFRRLLKRGFVPLLLLVSLVWVLFLFGVFDTVAESYLARAEEDTGRMEVWPLVIQRYLESPLVGVGASQMATYVPGRLAYMPHNSFLCFAVASGSIPLLLFVRYWVHSFKRSFKPAPWDYGPLRVPLLIYTLLVAFAGDYVFMIPWAMLAFSLPSAPVALAAHVARPVHKSQPHSSGPVPTQEIRPLTRRYRR